MRSHIAARARPALVRAKHRSDWHGAVAAQDTLAAFSDNGDLARHIRTMRQVYSQRKQILTQALQRHLPGKLSVIPAEGGPHIAALLRDGDPATQVVAAAAAASCYAECFLVQFGHKRTFGPSPESGRSWPHFSGNRRPAQETI